MKWMKVYWTLLQWFLFCAINVYVVGLGLQALTQPSDFWITVGALAFSLLFTTDVLILRYAGKKKEEKQ